MLFRSGPTLSKEELESITWSQKLRLLRAGVVPLVIIFSMTGLFLLGITSLVECSAAGAAATTLAALFNALLMVALVSAVSAAAVKRLLEPPPVQGEIVTWVALVGLLVNILVARLLMGGRDNINIRAALLHVMGDLLGSVAALVSGVVILYTGWTSIDPILSLFIVLLILISSLRLLREVVHTLLEGVPLHLELEEVGRAMAGTEGVVSVHDLHIWSLSAETTALSAHVVVRRIDDWQAALWGLRELLSERFGITHVTLQPEPLETVVELRRD